MRVNIQKLQFLRKGISGTDLSQPTTIKYAVWKDAMNHFLKTGDRNASISYINNRFNRFAEHRFDLIDRLHYLTELNCCIDDYIQRSLIPHIRKENFEFEIGSGVTVYGQVPRIDKCADNDNYYITFYIQETADWRQDIKYLLIQSWYAQNILDTDITNVYIGVYDIEKNRHEFISYPETEIEDAWEESLEISKQLMEDKSERVFQKQSLQKENEVYANIV